MKRHTFDHVFLFNIEEFQLVTPYKSVRLDNGAILTAPADKFEEAITQELTENGEVRMTAIGMVVESKLRKSK